MGWVISPDCHFWCHERLSWITYWWKEVLALGNFQANVSIWIYIKILIKCPVTWLHAKPGLLWDSNSHFCTQRSELQVVQFISDKTVRCISQVLLLHAQQPVDLWPMTCCLMHAGRWPNKCQSRGTYWKGECSTWVTRLSPTSVPNFPLPSRTGLMMSQAQLMVNKGTKFNFIAEAPWKGCPLSALIGRE